MQLVSIDWRAAEGQREAKFRAAAQLGSRLERASVSERDAPGKVQPQAQPLRRSFCDEALEQVGQEVRGDAWSGIGDAQHDLIGFASGLDAEPHLSAVR